MDLTESIAPKSDQLNAEDLLSGPRTFTIAEVKKGAAEQPVDVHLVEFPGRPFKPSKTVRRLMVAAWGKDSATYTGQRMTLYRDPDVRFGGMEVGGIRVSHMTGIDKAIKVALTVSRGKRAFYVVNPLADAPKAAAKKDAPPTALFDLLAQTGRSDKDAALAYLSGKAGRNIATSADLTPAELTKVIQALESEVNGVPA